MKRIALGCPLLTLLCAGLSTIGCRTNQVQDTVIASTANPNHTYRATILLREYFVDGHVDNSPTTYVILDENAGKPDYEQGHEFRDSQIIMKPTRCGPLSLKWTGNSALTITCEKCGISLTALGPHAQGMGAIKIDYDGFPEVSSWETAPRGR